MIELREEVKFYLSFMDEEVFEGVDLSEEDGDKPLASTTSATNTLGAIVAERTLPTQKATPAYAGWDTVLHPSWLVMAMGEVPPPTTVPREKPRVLQTIRTIPFSHHQNLPRLHPCQGLPCWPKHWH